MWKTLLYLNMDNLPILKDRSIIVKDDSYLGIFIYKKIYMGEWI